MEKDAFEILSEIKSKLQLMTDIFSSSSVQGCVRIDPGGLYYFLEDIKDQIKEVEEKIN